MNFFYQHAYDFGMAIGLALWPFFGARRRVAIANILRGGITADPHEARRIARRSFGHFVGHIFEALAVPKVINRDNWREHLDCSESSPEAMKLLLDSPSTPLVVVSSHHGVWEAATNIVSLVRPMCAVARKPNNKFVAQWMAKHHFRGEVTIIDKNRGFSTEAIRAWYESAAAMALLTDQYASKGSLLRFMGRPARTVTSAARLAMRYGVPVLVGSIVRVAAFQYRMVFHEPLIFDKHGDRDGYTQLINDLLEQVIRKYPEQYLWVHRRWRDD